MIKRIQYDKIGIISSSLCMIHCMGTPFIFIAKACTTTCCSNAPTWWLMIDYLFLIISFVAIYFTTTKELKSWIIISFWTIWRFLLLATLDHSFILSIFLKWLSRCKTNWQNKGLFRYISSLMPDFL